jgi:exodeoxyribonuclease V alpha subunit
MMSTEELRVTSVWQYDSKWVVYSGVPLKKSSPRTSSGRTVVVVKTRPEHLPMEPAVGQHWRIHGVAEERLVEHGDFIITEHHYNDPQKLEVTLPHDGEGFIRFIAKEAAFKGIGEVKARELWSTFGTDIYPLLEKKDFHSLCSVLSNQAALSLIDGYTAYANLRHANWFADHQIPPQIQQRLFKFHKEDSVEVIKANPYRLVTFGLSFAKTDQLAQEKFNVVPTDKRRLLAAIEGALRQHSRRGHTVARPQDIKAPLRRLLKDKELVDLAIYHGYTNKSFLWDEKAKTYHLASFAIMERVVAKRLIRLKAMTPTQLSFNDDLKLDWTIKQITDELPYPLDAKQIQAVRSALYNAVSCITGGAGTGKTTVLRTVLRAYDSQGYTIKAVALSGRAAMRLHESIGFETSTIAKLLKDPPIEDDKNTVVVIDEASMVDIGTMYRIVNHIGPKVRLLFVGDHHQLPPIGAGLVLADIVKSQAIPNVELDVVQRQDATTGIPEYSRMIRHGEIPPELSVGCIHFHAVDDEAKVAQACTDLYMQNPSDSRVVAATKKATSDINTLCQGQLNEGADLLEFTEYGQRYVTNLALGDPILFTQNHYKDGVQNGSLGVLLDVTQAGKRYGVVRLDDTGAEVELTKSLLDSVTLGYGITLHKAQGSQFKRVIVALSNTSMIDRAWLYTAITRAQVELHIVGSEERMVEAINSLSAHHKRQTHLGTLLAA